MTRPDLAGWPRHHPALLALPHNPGRLLGLAPAGVLLSLAVALGSAAQAGAKTSAHRRKAHLVCVPAAIVVLLVRRRRRVQQ